MLFRTIHEAWFHLENRIPFFARIAETRFRAFGWKYMNDNGFLYVPSEKELRKKLFASLAHSKTDWFNCKDSNQFVFTVETGRMLIGVEQTETGLWKPLLSVQAIPDAMDKLTTTNFGIA